jgi:hypothetical protein
MTKRTTAKRKPTKRRKPGWLRRKLGKWAHRKATEWVKIQKVRMRKTFGPKVIVPSAKRRVWQRRFPDPRRKPERVMERVEEWTAEFTAELDNGWRVPFQVDFYRRRPLDEAAYDAAEREHGPVARTRTIVDMEPCNDLAEEILLEGK